MRPSAARASKIGGRGTEVGLAGDHKASGASVFSHEGGATLHLSAWTWWDQFQICSVQQKLNLRILAHGFLALMQKVLRTNGASAATVQGLFLSNKVIGHALHALCSFDTYAGRRVWSWHLP